MRCFARWTKSYVGSVKNEGRGGQEGGGTGPPNGGGRGHVPPGSPGGTKKSGKYFSGQLLCKIRAFFGQKYCKIPEFCYFFSGKYNIRVL